MSRYAAFLRGISPTNAKMSELILCFEQAGLTKVRTVRSSGNVVFDADEAAPAALEKRIEAAMQTDLQRTFYTIVRSVDALQALLRSDPYKGAKIPANAKRVITFFRKAPAGRFKLPIRMDNAMIVAVRGGEAFSAYVPTPGDPVFMRLIQTTFGETVTTRTWETVEKVVRA